MTIADVPFSKEFRLRLRNALLQMIPNKFLEFTLEGEISVTEEKEYELRGAFRLGTFLHNGGEEDHGLAEMPAEPVQGTFCLQFRDGNDIPLNAPLAVDVYSYPE